MNLSFYNRLASARIAWGLTQSDLGSLVGVSKNTISSIECGLTVPSTFLALKICAVLHVRVEDVFFLSDHFYAASVGFVSDPPEDPG